MYKQELISLTEDYRAASGQAEASLGEMLSAIREGKSIPQEMAQDYERKIAFLNQCYESIVSWVRQSVPETELPSDGSKIDDYVDAYQQSRCRIITEQLYAAKELLNRFMQVKSAVKIYADALLPYQEKARASLIKIQEIENNLPELPETVDSFEEISLFLQILEIPDLDNPESITMIQEIANYYSDLVQFGLLREKYLFCTDTEQKQPEPELESEPEPEPEPEPQPEPQPESENPVPEERVIKIKETILPETGTPELQKQPIKESLFFHLENDRLIKYESSKSKKFGVKEFRSDMLKFKNSLNVSLAACKTFNGVSVQMLSAVLNKEESITEFMCSKLESLGYFNSYEIEDYGKFYVLSDVKGQQIFMHKDSASYLKAQKVKSLEDFGESIEDTADSALTRIVRLQTFALVKKIKPEYEICTNSSRLNYDSSVQVFHDFYGKDKNIMFLNISGNNPEQYEKFLEELHVHPAETVIVIGMTRTHARALAEWLAGQFPEQVQKGQFLYLNYASGIYYRYPDDTVFDFTEENFPEESTQPEKEPESEETFQEEPVQPEEEPESEESFQEEPVQPEEEPEPEESFQEEPVQPEEEPEPEESFQEEPVQPEEEPEPEETFQEEPVQPEEEPESEESFQDEPVQPKEESESEETFQEEPVQPEEEPESEESFQDEPVQPKEESESEETFQDEPVQPEEEPESEETFQDEPVQPEEEPESEETFQEEPVQPEEEPESEETFQEEPVQPEEEPDSEDTFPDESDFAVPEIPETPLQMESEEDPVYENKITMPKSSISDEKYAEYHKLCLQMLSEGKFCCAAAYARVLANLFDKFENYDKQIAFAFNDPMENCRYSSDIIFSTYFNNNTELSDYLVIAAVLRNYFSDQNCYDSMIRQLQDAVSSNPVLEENASLNQLVYALQNFKAVHHHGVDAYADYRRKDQKLLEKKIKAVQSEASALYDNYVEKKASESIPHKRLMETRKLIFNKKSDLALCLEAVKKDDRHMLELIEEYLYRVFIKDDCMIQEENIDPQKIEVLIEKNWQDAGKLILAEKKTSDLMGSLRMNLFKALQKVAAVLCNYAESVRILSGNSETAENIAYQRRKGSLLEYTDQALAYYQKKEMPLSLLETAGETVICNTLEEIRKRLDGTYDEREKHYFYLDFLKNGFVLLDDDYMPVLDEIYEIPNLSVLSRIENHFHTPGAELEDRLQAILRGEDDYGSARLILAYLKTHPEIVKKSEILDVDIDEALQYPSKDMENKRRNFIEDLELAQSYGQIDNTKEDMREALIQMMDRWYRWALQTCNYGFFYKILNEIRAKIKEDSQFRAIELEHNLDIFMSEHSGWEEDEKISEAVQKIKARIAVQNYAAAEDLLNRVIENDLDTGISYLTEDYLEEFLEEYSLNSAKAGYASNVLQLRVSAHNKDTKGAAKLIENWPKGSGTQPSRIKELFIALGFNIKDVTQQQPIQGKDHFFASLNHPKNGRKSNYTHPIAAFGSEAEEKGFRIISIFGKMTASRLIDMFKEIGNAKNTVILLDFTLSLADRRELARKAKTDSIGKTFIVIDRVTVVYLARHYSETAINRMLMAVTMPFAFYQPYISESSKAMAKEIFMGRKNELQKIESENGINIVYGGRQLGKSTLLRTAWQDINHDENGDRAVMVDIKNLNFKAAVKKVAEALFDEGILSAELLAEDWSELTRQIKKRLWNPEPGQKKIPYLLLLMDEADTFIESCEAVDFQPLDALYELQSIESGRFKFVIAGLRNIIRFKKNVALSNNHVLPKLGSLTIMPFKTAEARELLEVPLSYLGFRFPDDNRTECLISTIFDTTNYFPGLLQLYCFKLIEALQKDYAGYDEQEAPPYLIKEEHIKKALADSTLTKQIREKFIITLKVGDDDYYYLIALLAAYHYHNKVSQDGCSAQEIREIADSYAITKISSMTNEEVTALMEEMRELNVFQQVKDGRYRFSRLNFCQMMGNVQQIDNEILEYALH